MKTPVVKFSVIMFAFLVALICINNIYINRIADELEDMRRSLPSELTDENSSEVRNTALHMLDFWRSNRSIAGLSVAKAELDQLSNHLVVLNCAAEVCDNTEYRKSVALLTLAINDLRRLEQISFESLF